MADDMRQSVCVVVSSDWGASTRLKRLADIEDGRLVEPPAAPEDGWTMMYWNALRQFSGPAKLGTLGIWQWFGSPNYSDPDKIFILTEYLPGEKAVRVFPMDAADPAELCDTLQKNGVKGRESDLGAGDLFFAYLDTAGETYCGTLLPAADCHFTNGRIYPPSDQVSLPLYRVPAGNIFTSGNETVALASALGDPVSTLKVGNADKLIADSLVEALSWPYFKNHTGGNRLDWRTCKDLIYGLFTKSVKDKVAQALGLSPEEADHMVAQWVDKASNTAEFGSEDAQLMAAVAMKNEAVQTACMQKAADFWATEHAAKVKGGNQEIQKLNSEISRLKAQEAETRGTLEGLKKSTAASQKALSELDAKIAADKKLAEDTEKAVQKKIAHARENMAEFLAELSVFQAIQAAAPQPEPAPQPAPAPQPEPAPPSPAAPQPEGFSYTLGEVRTVSNRVVNPVKTWKDAVTAIGRNLSSIVSAPLRTITAAYLYSAYLCGAQILAVGPGGQQMADALSAVTDGKRSGIMRLESSCGFAAADKLLHVRDSVVTLQNLFRSGAVDFLPQAVEDAGRCLVWLHPYAEDLAVEPAGLYNYMLPVLTEPILVGKTMNSIFFGTRSSNFSSFHPMAGPLRYADLFTKLRLSTYAQHQIQTVLFTAANLAGENQAEIELLFGLLPLCTALGRKDVLQDALGSSGPILPEVAAALRRYTEDSLV